jgi:hypothetical protein
MAQKTKPDGNELMLQVPIDRDLHKKFKLRCLALDTTMTKQIQRMIDQFVKGKAQ